MEMQLNTNLPTKVTRMLPLSQISYGTCSLVVHLLPDLLALPFLTVLIWILKMVVLPVRHLKTIPSIPN
jgi:hypothetical protein